MTAAAVQSQRRGVVTLAGIATRQLKEQLRAARLEPARPQPASRQVSEHLRQWHLSLQCAVTLVEREKILDVPTRGEGARARREPHLFILQHAHLLQHELPEILAKVAEVQQAQACTEG